MSPLLNRANISSTYGSKVAALRRQANASSGGGSIPDGEAIFFTPGNGIAWVCPAGVTAARVVCVGGGGGAGNNGGGGGGGAVMKYYTNLVPGTTYTLDVGTAGDENRNSGGLDGTESKFYGPNGQTIEATGGQGGASSSAQGNTANGGQGIGGDINGTGGKGYPSANDPMGGWGWPFVPSDDACGSNGGAGGGGYGADNGWAGHGGSGSMYAGGGGGGGSDNECGGDGGPGGELAIGGYTQRAMGGGGGGTDGTHLSSDTRDGSGGGTLGGYGGVYGGNTGENKDSAVGGSGGNYGGTNGGIGGTGSGQQGGGGGGGSFGGGGAAGRYNSNGIGGGGGAGLVYIKHGKDFDGTDVGAHYPVATTFNGRFEKIYHTCNFTDNGTSQVRAPYGIRAGDLLIIMEYGPDVTSSITGNIPTGFTLCTQSSEHAAVDQRLFYRVADGTEGGNNYYGQVGSNEDTHLYVFRGPVPLSNVSEQQATYSDNQTGSGCALSMTLNQPSAPYSPYVFSVWTAGTRGSNNMYISGTNPASTSIGEGGGNGWYHNPSLRGKGGNEAECFSWRLDDTSGGSVNRDVAWTYGSTSRNTSLAMALNLDFTPPPAGQAVLNSAGNATTWTCPAGVHRVSVVCIGAGGGWTDATGDTTITFGSVTLTAGGGYSRNTNSAAGGSASGGDQNWSGGDGASSSYGAGGGSAAGYSGPGQPGGGGGTLWGASNSQYTTGSGSGAGGGSYTGNPPNGDSQGQPRGGGGVGMYGKGADATFWGKGGSGGQDSQSHNGADYGGGGGVTNQTGTRSGGGGALCWKNSIPVTPGTTYNAYVGGGGNGGTDIGAGGAGQIRIIWGYNRTFPNNNTADV